MPKSRTAVETPEQRELEKKRVELATLEGELAERELDFISLQTELRAFEGRYLRAVGTLYAELDELEARIAEAQARQHPHEESLRQRATHARAKATESAHALSTIEARTERFAPGDEVKSLYREVARTIHPDLGTDEKTRARRTRLMAQANTAYSEGDAAKLRAILEEWHSSPEGVEGDGIAAELVRIIRKIHQVGRRLQELHVAITELSQSPLHRLLHDVRTAEAVGRNLLAEMVEQLRGDIAAARSRVAQLVPTQEAI